MAINLLSEVENFPVKTQGKLNSYLVHMQQHHVFENNDLPDDETKNKLPRYNGLAADLSLKAKWEDNKHYGVVVGGKYRTNSYYTLGFLWQESYLFLKSDFGQLELGRAISASQQMKLGAETLAKDSNNLDGQYLNYVNLPMVASQENASGKGVIGDDVSNVKLPRFILLPQHPLAHGGYAKGYHNPAFAEDGFHQNEVQNNYAGEFGDLEYAPKITYYTPRIKGFKGGISYTHKAGELSTPDSEGEIQNVIDWGLSYVDSFNNLGVALSVTGEDGNYLQAGSDYRYNLHSIAYGINLIYGGWSLGGSFGNWKQSLQEKKGIYARDYDSQRTLAANDGSSGDKFSDANYYTLGIAYQIGPIALNFTHFASEFQKNEFQANGVGGNYRWRKNIHTYLKATHFEFDSNQPHTSDVDSTGASIASAQLKDNQGYVVLIGAVIGF